MTTCLRQFGIMVSPLSRAVGQRGVGLIALVTTGLRTLSTAGPPLWWSACTDFFFLCQRLYVTTSWWGGLPLMRVASTLSWASLAGWLAWWAEPCAHRQ